MEITINYGAVLIATIVAYAVGAFWHSPAGFGKYWMKLMGIDPEHMKSMPLSAVQAMIIGFFVMLLQAFVLAHFVEVWGLVMSGIDLHGSLLLGFWVWLGFLAPTLANGWLWERKSFKLFSFNAVYSLVSIEIMSVILALWR